MNDVAIRGSDASRSFGSRRALDACSFEVPTGCVSALVGLNGSGKTTLMRAAAGFLELNSGQIAVGGQPVRFAAPPLLGYLPQAKPLPGSLRVKDLIGYATELSGHRLDVPVARQWLEDEGLPPGQRVGDLSGGQRTQLALAVAVARGSAVLALDEPMADLDPLARERLAERLTALAAQGRTVLVSSHAVSELARWCDFLVVIDAGRALECTRVDPDEADGLESHVLDLLRAAQASRRTGGSRT